ncbi:hypothetical protein BGY98DRAFT_994698 [Russula aff. rugulosa BPL654]|nr:hypothetical protein BGY98DRAFT_994698 [Russula aff. rugulosa BPL654]
MSGSPNSFHHGPSRCTRASFELIPPREPQLTSPAGPTGFAHGAPCLPLHPATSFSTPRL